MPFFTTVLQKFDKQGEKTDRVTLGWTYIEVPDDVTKVLKPNQKTTFRVKGKLDDFTIHQVALMPTGRDGLFMMPINARMRRGIRKEAGATVRVELDVDDSPMPLSADLLACLSDDPAAQTQFDSLSAGHQRYFSNWIEEAKTTNTRTDRIAKSIWGLSMGMGFGEMIRYFKKQS